ncbi:MAG: DUF2190 family protein [Bacteroidales bacterium]|nr:DUF2190 family protein [Bacteroidales bacterium]
MNQFTQSPVVGELDLQTNPNPATFTCLFKDASETADTTLVPGEGAKLVDLGAADIVGINPIVDERAAVTDPLFGVKVFSTKKNAAVDGEIVQIAGKGAVMFLNSGAAILRGASVSLVLATPGNVITNVATGELLGVALDKASAANKVIRVLIDPEGFAT